MVQQIMSKVVSSLHFHSVLLNIISFQSKVLLDINFPNIRLIIQFSLKEVNECQVLITNH